MKVCLIREPYVTSSVKSNQEGQTPTDAKRLKSLSSTVLLHQPACCYWVWRLVSEIHRPHIVSFVSLFCQDRTIRHPKASTFVVSVHLAWVVLRKCWWAWLNWGASVFVFVWVWCSGPISHGTSSRHFYHFYHRFPPAVNPLGKLVLTVNSYSRLPKTDSFSPHFPFRNWLQLTEILKLIWLTFKYIPPYIMTAHLLSDRVYH